MSHHSSDGPVGPNNNETMKKLLEGVSQDALKQQPEANLGPTDRYPDGKVSPHDEGEIRFAVAAKGDKVFVDFGTPVHSLGMTREQALELGRLLITRAGYSCRVGFTD